MTTKRTQLSVIAVAVLAIVAVAVVMLLSVSGTQAENTGSTATLASDGGGTDFRPMQEDEESTPTPTPVPPTPVPQQTEPEQCGKPPDPVVKNRHYAVFDVYWDARQEYLVNNPCPPRAEHDANEVTTRYQSNIDIGKTIFHVRSEAEQMVSANSATDHAKYPFLYPNASGGVPGDPLSDKIWVLRSCEHDLDPPADDTELCVGFSAGLLPPDNWDGNVEYHFETIREPGIDPDDRGEAFAFANPGDAQAFWATPDIGRNAFAIAPGTYEHLWWVFTKPGTYVLGVHVQGRPDEDLDLPSWVHTVTSQIREYTFHVGKLADVSVALTVKEPAGATDARNTPLDPGETVTFTSPRATPARTRPSVPMWKLTCPMA